MTLTYFPGANTPQGFYSRFDAMLNDPRIHQRIYIKGGPGCGKSTLMRNLAQTAAEYGADTEQGLCSSDPGSLDAVMIPDAGLMVCDATAPHVTEPSLCGCDGTYLNLGQFYRTAQVQAEQPILKALQKDNHACYGRVSDCLRAAQALYRLREHLVLDELLMKRIRTAAQAMAKPLFSVSQQTGTSRGLFVTGVTPEGCISHYEVFQNASLIYLLQDSYHLSGIYLQEIMNQALGAGQSVIAGYSPLFPDAYPEQLYLPQSDTALIRYSCQFPCDLQDTSLLDLNLLVPNAKQERSAAAHAKGLTTQILSEAVRYLQEAKAIHDELETQLRPFVDFEGVTNATLQCQQLLADLLK